MERTTVLVVTWLSQDVTMELACPASKSGNSRSLCTIPPGSLRWSPLQIIPITMPGGAAGGPHSSSMASPTSL